MAYIVMTYIVMALYIYGPSPDLHCAELHHLGLVIVQHTITHLRNEAVWAITIIMGISASPTAFLQL